MEPSRCLFCYQADKCTICVYAPGKSLVNAYLVQMHLPLHLMQETRRQTPIGPTPRKIDRRKKYLPIWAISKNIVYHGVTIIATIHCILVDSIDRALGRERNPVHEANDVINKRLLSLHQSSIFPHLIPVRESHLRQWMTTQCLHSFSKHPIYRTAAHGRGESKNHAQMFIRHRAPQIEKKQSDIPHWTQRRWPSVTTMLCHVLQVKEIIHKHRKCASAQSSEVKKG
jgi:hypothetical protein